MTKAKLQRPVSVFFFFRKSESNRNSNSSNCPSYICSWNAGPFFKLLLNDQYFNFSHYSPNVFVQREERRAKLILPSVSHVALIPKYMLFVVCPKKCRLLFTFKVKECTNCNCSGIQKGLLFFFPLVCRHFLLLRS